MARRDWVFAVLLLAGCTQHTAAPIFPATVAGGWRLKTFKEQPPNSAPEPLRQTGTRRWWTAVYEGRGSATIEMYELTSSAGALDMVQKWRPAANTVVWYTPRYFIVAEWSSSDRAAVTSLIRTLQRQFEETR